MAITLNNVTINGCKIGSLIGGDAKGDLADAPVFRDLDTGATVRAAEREYGWDVLFNSSGSVAIGMADELFRARFKPVEDATAQPGVKE